MASTTKRATKPATKQALTDFTLGARQDEVPAAKPAKKEKRIRGTFSLPESDYALIAALKRKLKARKVSAKKNQLLRAGLRALADMAPVDLHEAIASLDIRRTLSRRK